jgi:hypothetical protein
MLPIFYKLSKAVEKIKIPKILPSFHNSPALPILSSFLDFILGKNSAFISFSIVFPFLDKLKRQTNSHLPSSQTKLHFEGTELNTDERGVRSFLRKDTMTCSESLEFMRRLMDHFTHLSNFEVPVDTELAIVIAAK